MSSATPQIMAGTQANGSFVVPESSGTYRTSNLLVLTLTKVIIHKDV